MFWIYLCFRRFALNTSLKVSKRAKKRRADAALAEATNFKKPVKKSKSSDVSCKSSKKLGSLSSSKGSKCVASKPVVPKSTKKQQEEGPAAIALSSDRVLSAVKAGGGLIGVDEDSFVLKPSLKNFKKNIHSRQYHRTVRVARHRGAGRTAAKKAAKKAANYVVGVFWPHVASSGGSSSVSDSD